MLDILDENDHLDILSQVACVIQTNFLEQRIQKVKTISQIQEVSSFLRMQAITVVESCVITHPREILES